MEGRQEGGTLWEMLGEVPDHREASGRRFTLRSILAITLAAFMAGRSGLAGAARWGRSLDQEGLEAFGIHRGKGPCHATFHNVFRGLNVQVLEQVLALWVRARAGGQTPRHVAIDGKTLRGSQTLEGPGVHLLAAYSEDMKGVLAEVPVPAGGNEITTALTLLKEIPLKGVLITGDAIFTQRRICQQIVEGGGDYLFTVKGNQPQLREDIQTAFAESFPPPHNG